MTKYYVYLLLCADGTYYTGITNDPERRLQEHESGTDMNAYTYTRRPVQFVWYDAFQTPTAAIEIDKQIKGWSRRKKQALIEGRFTDLRNLAVCQNASHHLRDVPDRKNI